MKDEKLREIPDCLHALSACHKLDTAKVSIIAFSNFVEIQLLAREAVRNAILRDVDKRRLSYFCAICVSSCLVNVDAPYRDSIDARDKICIKTRPNSCF